MIDKRVGTRPDSWSMPNKSGIRLDAFTYIGIIKNNLDPLKKGRLRVYIPDLGGNPDTDSDLITVSYASPFFGATPELAQNNSKNTKNEFKTVRHTYGMWMVPPDVENHVLLTFVAGDINRGFWFACVNSHLLSHGMTPGLGSVINWKAPGEIAGRTSKGGRYPTTEFNENDPALRGPKYLSQTPRPIHEEQFNRLVEQGLQDDTIRGTHSSSSQREAPSSTFGISTPGRSLPDTRSLYDAIQKGQRKVEDIKPEELKPQGRQGGHVFLMDDGDLAGNDNMIKLRSSGGHQIIMHDSANTMYISNSKGTVWIELEGGGNLNIFADGNFSVRAKGDLNLHSDTNINLSAGSSVNVKAADLVRVDSLNVGIQSLMSTKLTAGIGVNLLGGVGVTLQSPLGVKLNTGIPILPQVPLPVQMVPDTIKRRGKWVSEDGFLATSATIAPTHEPFESRNKPPKPAQLNPIETALRSAEIRNQALTGTAASAASSTSISASVPTDFTLDNAGLPIRGVGDTDPGILIAAEKMLGMKRLAPDRVNEQPDPPRAIPGLTLAETKAVLAQLASLESSNNYNSINERSGTIGKYQFSIAALIDRGYVKPEFAKFGNRALREDFTDANGNPLNAWRGTDGIYNINDFLNAKELQEVVMIQHVEANVKTMLANGALKSTDDKETRAGMITVAHLLGPNKGTTNNPGALGWRYTGQGRDGNNTTGTDYFNYGRYAMQALVPKTVLSGQTIQPSTSG